MYRLFLLFFSLFHACSFASDIVRYPGTNGTLQDRQEWSFQAASGEKSFWIGYSVQRLMYPNENFLSGVSINGDFNRKDRPSLHERIYGVKEEPADIREAARMELDRSEENRKKVWKEVGIFQKFKRGSRIPERSQSMNLTFPVTLDADLYWLGTVSHDQSFAYLTGLYSKISDPEKKEDVMSAIGLHPAQLAFPFLKKILTSNEPEEAQEAAAVFMGELETPEALRLLQEVSSRNPSSNVREAAVVGIGEMDSEEAMQVLVGIARSQQEEDLRETAIAMLGDKDGRANKILEELAWFDSDENIREAAVIYLGESEEGVPALLKIMEDHPSEDTREIAVHILAETVAGREVLKKKIKQ
jgi:hypothetical protein